MPGRATMNFGSRICAWRGIRRTPISAGITLAPMRIIVGVVLGRAFIAFYSASGEIIFNTQINLALIDMMYLSSHASALHHDD